MKSAFKQLYHLIEPQYGPREARAIALLAIEETFGWSQTDICLGKDTQLSAVEIAQWENICLRLSSGEPIQYVLGTAQFFNLHFRVTPATLIPRPETEQLVQLVLDQQSNLPSRILDIGTGSGCIAIALKQHCPDSQIVAWDISPEALQIARHNAEQHQIDVSFKQVDALLSSSCEHVSNKWIGDYIIISNPPYICESERSQMLPHVKDFEPQTALFVPNRDALCFYTAIALLAAKTKAVAVYCEINSALSQQTADEFRKVGYKEVDIIQDQFNRPRFITAHSLSIEST